jgi:hypothetical protein
MLFDTRLGGGGGGGGEVADSEAKEEAAAAPDDCCDTGPTVFFLGFRVLPSPFPMSSATARLRRAPYETCGEKTSPSRRTDGSCHPHGGCCRCRRKHTTRLAPPVRTKPSPHRATMLINRYAIMYASGLDNGRLLLPDRCRFVVFLRELRGSDDGADECTTPTAAVPAASSSRPVYRARCARLQARGEPIISLMIWTWAVRLSRLSLDLSRLTCTVRKEAEQDRPVIPSWWLAAR